MSEDDLKKRVDDIEKFLKTSFGDYIGSIHACQRVLFDQLIRRGVLKREEVGLILDTLSSKMASQFPDSPILPKYIKLLRDDINKADPYQMPDSTRGLFRDEFPPEKR